MASAIAIPAATSTAMLRVTGSSQRGPRRRTTRPGSGVCPGGVYCPCHGSKFSIKDGSVVNGPATSPLAPVTIKVEGTSIVQG
jgi:Rieske [2Fe-2S] domain